MHPVTFPPHYIERIIARRGRLHAFDSIEPKRTALIVVDMQNAFVAEGAIYECPPARSIVPAINRLAAALRQAGGEVIWLQSTPGEWPIFFEYFEGPHRRAACRAALADSSWGHALYPTLDVKPGERVVKKNRFSALIQGASDLEAHLRARGHDMILITGAATNGCCESTARDGMMLDFKVIMLSDACAAFNDENHLNGLWTVFQAFGDVRTTDETIALIEAGAARVPARRVG
ncbi:MAG: cysteine hydrolase [Alphaproteobacteria bacterium]|nr:cysteine hydrolase [Alphaproteobacteria bacterium]